ncbi:YceI family protein [Vibrio sp. 404]|uniref:YceI family protein n=1 Tax=Vibrio marinisediminis TaxID=2758441 RepID=A0A7W2IU52_9VIBR|nr:YceI family protein [Vibrio marinisediminis]MBA5763266.1 YceI family protein [Vibrio marinisediminis]
MKKTLLATGLTMAMLLPLGASAADYVIDTKGAHASINFKISHLGYSFIQGRFNTFDGQFSYDPSNIEASSIVVNVDTTSLDSNHAERDKHIRSADFIDASKYSTATFSSDKVIDKGNGTFDLVGELNLHGVTKPITINAKVIGQGQDPWGGERAGFYGTTRLELADYNIQVMGDSSYVDMELHVEGIKQ